MTTQTNENREQWLTQSAQLILTNVIAEHAPQQTQDAQYQISMGSLTKKTKTLGVCWSRSASSNNTNQIFISPFSDDSHEILATLTHELIHAIDDNQSGHKGFFADTATQCGLIGKMTATSADDNLIEYFDEIIEMLGTIPHAKLDPSKKPNIQKGRQVKVECRECHFKFNTSKKQILAITQNTCLVCGNANVYQVNGYHLMSYQADNS